MQTCKEKNKTDSRHDGLKRTKSATRFPKRTPTYVVAYSVQESYDDPPKTQKFHSKRSPQTSKSITPSISSRTITLDTTSLQRLNQALPIPETSNDMRLKIAKTDENQYGDVGRVSPETAIYIVDDTRMEDNLNIQPQIIFDSTKHRAPRECTRKKTKNNNHTVKIRNIHFKSKKSTITTKLDRYCLKAKQSWATTSKVQKDLYSDSISKIVSRSRILRKVLAKANLLEDSSQVTDDTGFNSNDNMSLTSSSPSTVKRSYDSSSSQNTLVRKGSTGSSRLDDLSIINSDSVSQMTPELMAPYKSDIINVGVAVTYSKPMPNNVEDVTVTEGKELFLFKENLTSTETVITVASGGLTENVLSSHQKGNENERYMNDVDLVSSEDVSNQTLVARQDKPSNESSDCDTFVIAKTSSDFHKSSLNSSYTLTANSETIVHSENLDHIPTLIDSSRKTNITSTKLTLLDTFRKICMFPEITPSTSSACNDSDMNDVLIVSKPLNHIPICKSPNSKGDQSPKKARNILKKFFDTDKTVAPQKNITLPNEVVIKSIFEPEKPQKRCCSEESRNNYPSTVPELWDKLVLVLDLAVKRLEETLADKIVMEIKKSLPNSEQYHFIPSSSLEVPTSKMINEIMGIKTREEVKLVADKEILAARDIANIESDKGLQCDLVQNQVIDQLMQKLSIDTPIIPSLPQSSIESAIKQPELIKDYFEVLKPPAGQSKLEEVITVEETTIETLTGSSMEPEATVEQFQATEKLKQIFTTPIKFIVENCFVITSVPTFFIVLFVIYALIVLIVKP